MMDDLKGAAEKVAALMKTLIEVGGMRWKFRITAGPGAADPDGLEAREIYVEIAGPDAPLLTQRGGEVLRALEHLAAKIVRLENEEHDKISFDSNNFKALRAREMRLAADAAAERVQRTGVPFSFQPMSSRERRMLHLALRDYADLETESSGEGLRRFVVLYRKGQRGAVPVAAPAGFNRAGGRPSGGRPGGPGGGRRSGPPTGRGRDRY